MSTHGWLMLMFDRKQQNSVKPIILLLKNKLKKKRELWKVTKAYVVQGADKTIFLLTERKKKNQITIDGHSIV